MGCKSSSCLILSSIDEPGQQRRYQLISLFSLSLLSHSPFLFPDHHNPSELHNTIMIPRPPPFEGGVAEGDEFPRRDERLPHWSHQETKDLIEMRGQVEWGFAAAKKTKNLWEMVAEGMSEKGYWRTANQCKWKWKSLVSKYKGQEASYVNAVRPSHNELDAVFTARAHRMRQSQAEAVAFAANSMQLAQAEAEAVVVRGRKRLHDPSDNESNEEFTEEQEDEEEIEAVQQGGRGRAVPKRRAGREKRQMVSNNGSFDNGLSEIMMNFMQQQLRIDMEWRAAMDKIAQEREQNEQEWRQKMERLDKERLTIQRAWIVREEEWRMREESLAEQRDELITALLTRLINDD